MWFFHSLWIVFLETSRRFDLSSRSLGHVMVFFAGTAQEAGAGGRSGAAGMPVRIWGGFLYVLCFLLALVGILVLSSETECPLALQWSPIPVASWAFPVKENFTWSRLLDERSKCREVSRNTIQTEWKNHISISWILIGSNNAFSNVFFTSNYTHHFKLLPCTFLDVSPTFVVILSFLILSSFTTPGNILDKSLLFNCNIGRQY